MSKFHYEGDHRYLNVFATAERPERGFRPEVTISRRWNAIDKVYEYSIGGSSFGGDHARALVLASLLNHAASIANDLDFEHYAVKAMRYHYSNSNTDQAKVDLWIEQELAQQRWFDGLGPMPEHIRLQDEADRKKRAEAQAKRDAEAEAAKEAKRVARNAKRRQARADKKKEASL